MSDNAFEKHYLISELAKLWNISVETVRRAVLAEPDVMKLTGPSGKTSYRIPESVARRIHTKLVAPRQRHPELLRKS